MTRSFLVVFASSVTVFNAFAVTRLLVTLAGNASTSQAVGAVSSSF